MPADLFALLTDPEALVRAVGLSGIAVIVFIETGLFVGFFLPGDSLLVTAGLFASQGLLPLGPLLLLVTVMAIAGDATGYWIGTRFGGALAGRRDSRLFRREHLLRTQVFYEQHGGKTIVIARFVPIVRTFAPVVAGIAGMPYGRFAAFNVTGGVLWVFSMVLTGWILGNTVPGIAESLEIVIVLVVGLSLVPGVVHRVHERKARRDRSERLDALVDELAAAIQHAAAPGESSFELAAAVTARLEATAVLRSGSERMSVAAEEGVLVARLEDARLAGGSPAARELTHRFLADRLGSLGAVVARRMGSPDSADSDHVRWHLIHGTLILGLREPSEQIAPAIEVRFLPSPLVDARAHRGR